MSFGSLSLAFSGMHVADGTVFTASLVVRSGTLSMDEVSERLGRADVGWSRGDAGFRGRVREWTRWERCLPLDPCEHAGTAGLDGSIAGLGDELAARLADLSRAGCAVVLSVVQEFPVGDTGDATGLHLSASSLAWLASAGAELDVDQYVIGGAVDAAGPELAGTDVPGLLKALLDAEQ